MELETGKPANLGDQVHVVAREGSPLFKVVNEELGIKAVLSMEWNKDDDGIRIGQPLSKAVGENPEIVTNKPTGDLSKILSSLLVPGTQVSKVGNEGVSKSLSIVQRIKPPAS